jgi:hypothetical protein
LPCPRPRRPPPAPRSWPQSPPAPRPHSPGRAASEGREGEGEGGRKGQRARECGWKEGRRERGWREGRSAAGLHSSGPSPAPSRPSRSAAGARQRRVGEGGREGRCGVWVGCELGGGGVGRGRGCRSRVVLVLVLLHPSPPLWVLMWVMGVDVGDGGRAAGLHSLRPLQRRVVRHRRRRLLDGRLGQRHPAPDPNASARVEPRRRLPPPALPPPPPTVRLVVAAQTSRATKHTPPNHTTHTAHRSRHPRDRNSQQTTTPQPLPIPPRPRPEARPHPPQARLRRRAVPRRPLEAPGAAGVALRGPANPRAATGVLQGRGGGPWGYTLEGNGRGW